MNMNMLINIYIVSGQIYIAPRQIYDLMSDKYITLLLIIL